MPKLDIKAIKKGRYIIFDNKKEMLDHIAKSNFKDCDKQCVIKYMNRKWIVWWE